MSFRTWMRLLIAVVGFSIWTYIVFYAPELQNSEYLKFVQGAVVVVVGLALRDDNKTVSQTEKKDEVLQ